MNLLIALSLRHGSLLISQGHPLRVPDIALEDAPRCASCRRRAWNGMLRDSLYLPIAPLLVSNYGATMNYVR